MKTRKVVRRVCTLLAVLMFAGTATESVASSKTTVQRYGELAQEKIAMLTDVMQQLVVNCDTGVMAKCRTALELVGVRAGAALEELSRVNPPDCLAAAHSEFTGALATYVEASNESVRGIDADDSAQISSGANKIEQGNAQLEVASSLVDPSKCR